MSQPTSQPESIDLAYDMWAGQFEFIGPDNSNNNNNKNNNNNNNSSNNYKNSNNQNYNNSTNLIINNNNNNCYSKLKIRDKNSSQNCSTESLEDLNFNFDTSCDFDKQPILIDQETFLSLNPNDFDDIIQSGPNSMLELLQRQVTDLADSQNIVEDRTTRTKTDYAVLQARYHMLEEQYRESELRYEERLIEEQKRHRELLARVEREAALQNENCQIKISTIELERKTARDEVQRLRILCDKQANDLHLAEEKIESSNYTIQSLNQDLDELRKHERKYEQEKKASEDLMVELSRELERAREETGPAMPTTSPETIRLEELHQELDALRHKNKDLEEQIEELQAAVLTRGVEEGRHLLNGTLNSLAQELEEMSQTQNSVDSATLASLSQLQQAFHEKEDENTRLKTYIDTILLNIVENYPQLLEVKPECKN